MKNLEATMKDSCIDNISRFYISTNWVIDNIAEIE